MNPKAETEGDHFKKKDQGATQKEKIEGVFPKN